MDADGFDRLAKAFFRSDTRRHLLGLLPTAPVLGALTVLLSPEEGEAGHPVNRLLRRKKQRRLKARKERRRRHRQRKDQNQPDGGDGGGGGDLVGRPPDGVFRGIQLTVRTRASGSSLLGT